MKCKLGKAGLIKFLKERNDVILSKPYGKTVIYCARQEATLDQASQKQLEDEVSSLELEGVEVAIEAKGLKRELVQIKLTTTDNDAQSMVDSMTTSNGELEDRLQKIKNGKVTISEEDQIRIVGKHSRALKVWKKYKKVFKSVWDGMTESSDTRFTFDDFGLEESTVHCP